ncbi:MAG: catalase-peroxidase, partial [Candidatus Nanopelagicales bacterium]|nr:catalase-peroxidase [Candidatus Nanopelagicales bacterium]
QWIPVGGASADTVPDAHDPSTRHAPIMFTTDLALRTDPIYEPISRQFLENPEEFADAFARAWFKLTHRDMGPKVRYLGSEVPEESLIWQDPVPAPDAHLITDADAATLKSMINASGLTAADLVQTAWASASTFRGTDKRGGANGARIRLEPQNQWAVNNPDHLAQVLGTLEGVQAEFNAAGGAKVSMADLIVLGGAAGIESAAAAAGHTVTVPFTPGRTDATQEMTDVESFAALEPAADGMRNYVAKGQVRPTEQLMVDKANLLGLSAPEMSVLVAGMRVIGTNADGSDVGVLTERKGQLTNDYFVNMLDMGTTWEPTDDTETLFEGKDRASGDVQWTASRMDLVFGSNSQLRAVAEAYGCADAHEKFVADFVAAWDKVMMLDRFEVKP